jgi:hypothetical protein
LQFLNGFSSWVLIHLSLKLIKDFSWQTALIRKQVRDKWKYPATWDACLSFFVLATDP